MEANSTVASTSTRNFPNRLGDGVNMYQASAELAAAAAITSRLLTVAEYMEYSGVIEEMSSDICKYLSFDEIASFMISAETVRIAAVSV